MYINYQLARSKGVSPTDFHVLQIVKQMKTEDLSKELEHICLFDEETLLTFAKEDGDGWITFIQGNKGDSLFKRARLTDKGKDLLELISVPKITEDDVLMAEYLMDMYIKAPGTRVLGNKKNILQYTSEFRQIVGLTHKEMFYLCVLFIQEHQYNQKLECIFFVRVANQYGKFKDNIADSKLYQFYDERKEEVKAFWKLKIKET